MTEPEGAASSWIESATIRRLEASNHVRTVVSPTVIDLLGDISAAEKLRIELWNRRSRRAARRGQATSERPSIRHRLC